MSLPQKSISTIDKLIIKAKKNNFESAYQLYEYYLNGTYVEKSIEQAEKYLLLAKKIFEEQNIKLTEINIENFRVLKQLSLKFRKTNLIIIAGNNGAGKTSILDAISMNLSWLINRIVYKGGKGKEISNTDITLNSENGYSSLLAKFSLNKKIQANLELVALHDGSSANKKSYYVDITRIGSIYKSICKERDDFNLPILAYYSILRSSDITSKDISVFDEVSTILEMSRFDGYTNSLIGKVDFKSFFKWFKRIDDIEKHRTLSAINERTFVDNKLIEKLEKLAESSDDVKDLLTDLKEKSRTLHYQDKHEINKIKSIINSVINSFMDGYSNLSIEVEPSVSLTIEKNGKKLNILQLSQGEKSLLSLVIDIARRLIILNPSLDNPLDGNGIVLIDEVDMHLHPEWQRKVIKQLPKTFKNCQFIVSTHSPQVMSEVKDSQLIILKSDSLGNVTSESPEQSYGLTSNEILNEVMLKNSNEKQLTRNAEVEKSLNDIHNKISEKKFTEAKALIKKLESELNGEIPELISAKIEIDLYGWDD
ncbi:hypothetical protein CBW58_01475 [Yersinia frederiksenii]|nr:hypothetical protein CBW58_23445 [Yersinia frederiksenii]OVZ94774.1 hypothetical protein CBW58_01475 [Yersinia frederiksenii]